MRDALSALDASIFVCAVCQDALMDDYKCLPCEHRYCGGCHNRLSKRCSVCREPSDKTIPDVCGRAVLHLMLRASKCGTVKLPLSRLLPPLPLSDSRFLFFAAVFLFFAAVFLFFAAVFLFF